MRLSCGKTGMFVYALPLLLFTAMTPQTALSQQNHKLTAPPHREEVMLPPDASFVPPCVSTADWPEPKPDKSKLPEPVSQKAVADAVLGDTIRNIWLQIDRHFHEGEYNHIINLNRLVAQCDPTNVEAYSNASWLLWSTGQKQASIDFLKQGVGANPDNYYMYDELGAHFSTRLKDYPSALPYYEKAVQFRCPYTTWHGLAHCYENTNQWDKALQAWETAAKYPDDRLAHSRVKRVRAEVARRKGRS